MITHYTMQYDDGQWHEWLLHDTTDAEAVQQYPSCNSDYQTRDDIDEDGLRRDGTVFIFRQSDHALIGER